ncbi:MAG: AAA family ATPase, partial [Longimicrobiales bacterium]
RRTYAACLRATAEKLCQGGRVIVDATFRDDAWRVRFMQTARRLGVRHVFLVTTCDSDVVRERIRERGPGPSDADWEIHRKVAERWEAPSDDVARRTAEVDTGTTPEDAVARGLEILRSAGLMEGSEEEEHR